MRRLPIEHEGEWGASLSHLFQGTRKATGEDDEREGGVGGGVDEGRAPGLLGCLGPCLAHTATATAKAKGGAMRQPQIRTGA